MVSVEAVHVPILVHNGLRYPSLARRRRPDQRRELRDGGVEMPKLSRDFVLPVVAAVLGTIAILCVLLVVVFVCTRTRRATRTAATLKTTATTSASSSSNNPATAPMSRSGGSATLVVQRDTSSIVSASDSVAPPSVPFTPSFRRAQSSDAQSSIYENFGGRSPALNSRGYPADDDFDDVWSYAMTEDESGLVVSHLTRMHDKSDVGHQEQGIEVPHSGSSTQTDLTTPTLLTRTNTGRSLYEV